MNNLEQKLKQNTILCEQVDKVICMTVEIKQAKLDLQTSDLSQSVIQYQIQNLEDWLHKNRSSIQQNVIDTLHLSEREIIYNYMTKVQKTLNYCISHYDIYLESKYHSKHSSDRIATQNGIQKQ